MTLYFLLAVILLVTLAILLWPVRQQKHFCRAVIAIFFIGGFGLYYALGAPEMIPLLAQREEKIAALKTEIIKNSEAVKADPKNLAAWVALGQSFIETNQYDAAANAFKQSVLLSGGDPVLIFSYAKALILTADGKVTDAAKKSLEMVLLQQPDNPEARYWLIVRQLQDGHTQDAMKVMKKLYRSLPDDAPLRKMIDKQIGRAS